MPHVRVTGRRAAFDPARATEAFRDHLGVGRAEAKSLTDAILVDDHPLTIGVATVDAAHELSVALCEAGVDAEAIAG
jgi:hypothetical protein